MAKYLADVLDQRSTAQSAVIPGREADMTPNNAGGYSFAVTDWTRFQRFLILGSEGGSYYASEQKLTLENAQAVVRCVKEDGLRTVREIVAVSDGGRAAKNDPAIFALAVCAARGDTGTRAAALQALPQVCRTGTHLFHFAQYVDGMRGWGRGLRQAVANWYLKPEPQSLAYQLVKYQSRDGWSHRDLLRLAHPKTVDETRNLLLRFGAGKEVTWPHPDPDSGGRSVNAFMAGYEALKRAATAPEAAKLIREHNLPREVVPTHLLNSPEVWEALLQQMPLTAMIRNLGKMSAISLLAPMSAASKLVVERLGNREYLQRSRVHPLTLLMAQKVYEQGHGDKGSLKWTVVSQVVDALDAAFYAAFQNVEPTGKRHLLALDVSSSMANGSVAGSGLTPRDASAAMALVTAATEPHYQVVGFTAGMGKIGYTWHRQGVPPNPDELTPLTISPKQRLRDAVQYVSGLPFGGTDCALPMLYALKRKLVVDTFVVYTDSETWAGSIHPSQALQQYRNQVNPNARLAVVGMVANSFSIADPADAGMLDFVGFDTAVPAVLREFSLGQV